MSSTRKFLKLLYRLWMKFGAVLNYINSRILLGLVFFLILTPGRFILQLLGHNPLNLRRSPHLQTYRKNREYLAPQLHMRRPY